MVIKNFSMLNNKAYKKIVLSTLSSNTCDVYGMRKTNTVSLLTITKELKYVSDDDQIRLIVDQFINGNSIVMLEEKINDRKVNDYTSVFNITTIDNKKMILTIDISYYDLIQSIYTKCGNDFYNFWNKNHINAITIHFINNSFNKIELINGNDLIINYNKRFRKLIKKMINDLDLIYDNNELKTSSNQLIQIINDDQLVDYEIKQVREQDELIHKNKQMKMEDYIWKN